MLSVWVSSFSAPSMEIRMSSPRAAKICSLSTRNRSLAVSVPRCTSAFRSVGRMPIITTRVPVPRAFSSPALRSSLTTCSSSASASPASRRGGTLISRLNCPTSTPQAGSAIASSTSALRMDGMASESTRFSSISWPTCAGLSSNRCSRSIRASASSERRTFSRYSRRSSPLNLIA